MGNLKFSSLWEGKRQEMFLSKSIAFDEEELAGVALPAGSVSVCSPIEAEFIEKLKDGDANAFDTFVTRYARDVYALLFRLKEDTEESGDLT